MSHDARLESLGWTPFFEEHWTALASDAHVSSLPMTHAGQEQAAGAVRGGRACSFFPARIVADGRGIYRLQQDLRDVFLGEPTGRTRRDPEFDPTVGDWVVCTRGPGQERASVHAILPRRSCLARREAGRSGRSQLLAANVDVGFVVTSLNTDLNPRRIERYLATIWDGGARPVVLLTKRDLCTDAGAATRAIERIAARADVLAISALTGEGLESLDEYLRPGLTSVLLGSSGAGKSTLINRLLAAEVVPVQAIRSSDGRGRHTTTSRQLWALPSGALVIDTPGMRELQLLVDAGSLVQAFDDLGALAVRCRFTDCAHRTEPGCAVRAAVARGTLSRERLASYEKLSRELEFQARKEDKAKASREKERWKAVSKLARERGRRKLRGGMD